MDKKHLVFNELSMGTLPNTETDAVKFLEHMHKLLMQYRKKYVCPKADILCHRNISSYCLTNANTDIKAIWKLLPFDIKAVLLSSFTNQPLVKEIPPYYSYKQQEAIGFAYAHENDLYAISYNHLVWSEPMYELQKIDENQENIVSVAHLCEASIDSNSEADFFESLDLQNVQELWGRRAEIFPNLIFCGLTKKQIESANLKSLKVSVNKLQILNEAIKQLAQSSKNVTQLEYKNLGMNISGESESTLQQHSKDRTFEIPNTSPQRSETFELHIKLSDVRIHFFLDKETNACYIGYIGKHLPTSKFK